MPLQIRHPQLSEAGKPGMSNTKSIDSCECFSLNYLARVLEIGWGLAVCSCPGHRTVQLLQEMRQEYSRLHTSCLPLILRALFTSFTATAQEWMCLELE